MQFWEKQTRLGGVGCGDERVFGDEFDDQAAGLWIVENNDVHVIIKLFAWSIRYRSIMFA
jgi:hypothetical protein